MSFDLTKCETIPATHYKAKTRDGRDVEIFHVNGNGVYSILGIADGGYHRWAKDGNLYQSLSECPLDLINIPRKIKVNLWLNVYADGSAYSYRSKDDADMWAGRNRIGCIHIEHEVEVGEGL